MRVKLFLLISLGCVLSFSLTACLKSEDSNIESSDPVKTVDAFYKSMLSQEWERSCQFLTDELKADLLKLAALAPNDIPEINTCSDLFKTRYKQIESNKTELKRYNDLFSSKASLEDYSNVSSNPKAGDRAIVVAFNTLSLVYTDQGWKILSLG